MSVSADEPSASSKLDFWVAECVKHFVSTAVALELLESLDGFRYLMNRGSRDSSINPAI
jgi:hypothetical protein